MDATIQLPIYTAYTTAAIMILQVLLVGLVGASRFKHKQTIGIGDHPELLLAIRRHANLTENAPLYLFMLGLIELIAGSTSWVLGLGVGFFVARLAHAVGLSKTGDPNIARAIGSLGTMLLSLIGAGYLLWIVI